MVMLVKEYVENVLEKRAYKYSTKISYVKGLKSLGIWELDLTELKPSLVMDRIDSQKSHNVRRNSYIILRSVFKELGIFCDLPKLESIPKQYQFPSQEEIHLTIEKSKYRLQLLLCMYAGLRVGEACAVTPEDLEGNWLNVTRAFSQDGKHVGTSKTQGKVLIPEWLAQEIRNMRTNQYWRIGMPTQLVSWACGNLSKRRGRKSINPHMLRHWFATDMIKRGINPEIVRRQMRHKNVNTTLKIYTQIQTQEIEEALPSLPNNKIFSNGVEINSVRKKHSN
jgi:integrase